MGATTRGKLGPRDRGVTDVVAKDGDGTGATGLAIAEEPQLVVASTNRPFSFDLGLVESIRVNPTAARARAADLGHRRGWKKEQQIGVLVLATQCIDLTTLAGDDTWGRVDRLCAKALSPVRLDILEALGLADIQLTVGAVCVYPAQVKAAATALKGRIPVASVATGFPAGQTHTDAKIAEIKAAMADGATEIDVVIPRELALTRQWRRLYEELVVFRNVCDGVKLKVILGIGNLDTLETVAKASAVAIMAGADTIKTSTGYEPTNATLEGGLVMLRQIRRFGELGIVNTHPVGFKPAGGIRTAKDVMLWMTLVKEELGNDWLKPDRLRIGASGLLTDIERQLEHNATGRYSGAHRHPMA